MNDDPLKRVGLKRLRSVSLSAVPKYATSSRHLENPCLATEKSRSLASRRICSSRRI